MSALARARSISRLVTAGFVMVAVAAGLGALVRAQLPQDGVGSWAVTATTDPMAARTGAATATLANGATVIAGGLQGGNATASVVIYNAVANTTTPAPGQLLHARVNAAATVLEDGRVFISGGEVGGEVSGSAELFNLQTGESTLVPLGPASEDGQPTRRRTRHASARLADGKVLIVGGSPATGVTLASADIFDPATNSVTATDTMTQARAGLTATTLIDGRVLIVGGNDGAQELATAELYYPGGGFLPVETTLSVARAGHTALLLPFNGSVLVAGGVTTVDNVISPVTTTDLFLPAQFPDPYSWSMGSFAATGSLAQARSGASSGPAGSGGYAFAAGGGAAETERYRYPTLKTDKDDYAPGEQAIISGAGWLPGEQIKLLFQEDPAVHQDYELTVTAEDGTFTLLDWTPEAHDFGVRFYLLAVGQQSGRRAQVTFTDGGTLTITFAGTGSGSITSSTGTPTSCTTTCAIVVTNNGNFTVTATPATGSTFGGWSGSGCDSVGSSGGFTNNVCTTRLQGTNVSRSATVTFNAASVATTTTVQSSSNPSTYGSSISFVATVSPSSGSTPPTGAIQFKIDGSNFGSAVNLTPGATTSTATSGAISTLDVPGSTHLVEAVYTPTGSFTGSSGSLNQAINPASSTTVITCPASVTYTGTPLTPCTAAVTGAGGLNTSATVVYGNNTNAGTATANATYAGDANHEGSTATQVTFTIAKASSTTVITCPASVTYTGTPLTPCTAAVTGAGGLNTSATVVYGNNTNAGTATADASYVGDANHEGSTATQVTFTITKALSTTTITCQASVTYTGAPLTPCTAAVTGAGGLSTSATVVYGNNTNAGTATANATYAGDLNHEGSTATQATFTIAKAPSTTVVVCPPSVVYNGSAATPCTASITGANLSLTAVPTYLNNTSAGTATASYTYPGDANHTGSSGSATFIIEPRDALVRYIGQLMWVTSGTSSTTAQVTLTASVQDPTGTALVGATADFIDVVNNKVMAKGVKVTQVAGSAANTGTANSVVTLSTGQYGAESYLIRVVLTGNYDNTDQGDADKTATVAVSKPAATNEAIGTGTLVDLPESAGTLVGVDGSTVSFTAGMKYNKSGTNPQGKITLVITQADGSTIYVKSNSISSMQLVANGSPKKMTIYTKAAVSRLAGGVLTTIDGNTTLRTDIEDGGASDKIGFTVLSSKDSTLFYSNNWVIDSMANAWKTVVQALLTGTVAVN